MMIKVADDTALVGIAELRKEIPKLTKDVMIRKIIVLNRGKPVGVLESYAAYLEKEDILEKLEDLVLGNIAKQRFEASKKKDFITEEEAARRLGVKL